MKISDITQTTNLPHGVPNLVYGDFLIFMLASEAYAINIKSVRELRGEVSLTQIAGSPDYVRGVASLRGSVIPFVDLCHCFKLAGDSTPRTAIILDTEQGPMGLLAGQIHEVVQIMRADVLPFACKTDTQHILGLVTMQDRLVTILDLNTLLASLEYEKCYQTAGLLN
ncbi:chemotaxis protein CheW [Undibacterium sp. TS12]|uniref:chemotaxis protein CheW n=1 Tax=Undibacterium sp. TS12 TaxID=2908202 RepID=UPI001F4D08A3|nr:chemotaxis protein CheW [Undibacterium sp. TS12]MCH8622256.1 chemotaxis protein CheW [Undibacterium sp. TS12]